MHHRYRIAPALLLAGFLSSPVSAQTSTTLSLSLPITADGIVAAPQGGFFAAEGYEGSKVFHVTDEGTVTEVASGLDGPIHVAHADDGTLYVATYNDSRLTRVAPDGTHTVLATGLDGATGVVWGPDGALYVASWGASGAGGTKITRVTTDGDASLYVQGQGIVTPQALAFDDAGALYIGNAESGVVWRVPRVVERPAVVATLPQGNGYRIAHMVSTAGTMYLTNPIGGRIYAYDVATGDLRAALGSTGGTSVDGTGSVIRFSNPWGITASADGSVLYVLDGGPLATVVRRVELPDFQVTTQGSAELGFGQSASVALSATAMRNVAVGSTLSWSCSTDTPDLSCSLSTPTGTLTATGMSNQLTVEDRSSAPLALLLVGGLGLLGASFRPRRTGRLAALLVAGALLGTLSACGGGEPGITDPEPQGPSPYSGTVTVTVTSDSGFSTSASTAVQVR